MNEVNPNKALQREMLGFALLTPTYGLLQRGFPTDSLGAKTEAA